jgi:predicted nucleic acid-binding protein
MPGSAAFFDTSAIIPLCVAQAMSQRARHIYRDYSRQVIAWTCLVEATGAIYRAVRYGALSEQNAGRAVGRLMQLQERWVEITATDQVRDIALEVVRIYDVRAADSLQLASALIWCKQKPRNRLFVCFDQKLAAAAKAVGFDTAGTG